jgi:hypothetical protein
VVIKYTKKLSEAYDAYKNYKENVSEKVWILNYTKK